MVEKDRSTMISLEGVSLDYPIYNSVNFSLRHQLVKAATGGQIFRDSGKVTFVRALSNVNLKLEPGDRVGIMGHNGAGKTTLLRCIAGIHRPTSGHRQCVGTLGSYLEISAGLEPELTGFDNIRRLLMLRGVYEKYDLENQIGEIIQFSELNDFIHLPVRTYSSGMQMRLIFSAITADKPEIIIMDEFFGTGDEAFQQKAKARLQNQIDAASILVFASHNTELLKSLCNRFCRLTNGTLEEVHGDI